jgi:hypothetical protein
LVQTVSVFNFRFELFTPSHGGTFEVIVIVFMERITVCVCVCVYALTMKTPPHNTHTLPKTDTHTHTRAHLGADFAASACMRARLMHFHTWFSISIRSSTCG